MPRIPPKGRPVQKGEIRNPMGSSAKARAQAALKRAHKTMTPDEFALMVSMFLHSTPKELLAARNAEDATVLTKMVAKFINHSHDKADIGIFKVLLEACIGKPRERKQHEHSGPEGGPIRTTQAMTDEEIAAELAAIRARKAH